MESKDNIIKIILAIVCALCIILVWSSFKNLKNMELSFNEKKAVLVKENLDLKDRLESIQAVIEQKTDMLASLEKEKETVSEKLRILDEEHKKLNIAYNKLRLTQNSLLSEREEMTKQLDELRSETASLAEKVKQLETSPLVEKIKNAIAGESNENIKKVLEEAVKNIELIKSGKSVNLTPIVVTGAENVQGTLQPKQEEAPAAPAQEQEKFGKVLSADSKDNLVIIDIGRKDKIKEGDHCKILKGEETIAYGEVVSVRYNLSAIYVDEIKYKHQISDIREGDTVLMIKEVQ